MKEKGDKLYKRKKIADYLLIILITSSMSLKDITLAYVVRTRDGTGQDFLDPTGKFQNHHRLTGRSTGF